MGVGSCLTLSVTWYWGALGSLVSLPARMQLQKGAGDLGISEEECSTWVGQIKRNYGGRHLSPEPWSAATLLADWQCLCQGHGR